MPSSTEPGSPASSMTRILGSPAPGSGNVASSARRTRPTTRSWRSEMTDARPWAHVRFRCNGTEAGLGVQPDEILAHTLRERMGLTGTKLGCETGDCGACTVLIDGEPVCSCLVLTARCDGSHVWTIEGVSRSEPGRQVAAAFADEDAVQCGICSPGFVVTAVSLIESQHGPLSAAQITAGLAGNLCRCTGYQPIIAAV